MILPMVAALGSILPADGALRIVDRYLVLTEKGDSLKHIFHVSPDLKINFEEEDVVIDSDSVTARIPRKNIAGYSHVGPSSLTLNVVANNEDATPLPNVDVKILSESSVCQVDQTDNNGTLRFSDLAPGYYKLEISGHPLFEEYKTGTPFLHLEDSEMRIVLGELVKKPEITSFKIIENGSDLYDLQFSWAIDGENPDEDFGYTYSVSVDGVYLLCTSQRSLKLGSYPVGEHSLSIQGISPFGSVSEPCEYFFNIGGGMVGVSNIASDNSTTSDLYDLNGLSVNPSNASQGIYILPGENKSKKIIIR